jgi:hypothetical protein
LDIEVSMPDKNLFVAMIFSILGIAYILLAAQKSMMDKFPIMVWHFGAL